MLYRIANELLRSGHYYEAALAFDFLSLRTPSFLWYAQSKLFAEKKFAAVHQGKKPRLRWKGMNPEDYALVVYDAVISRSKNLPQLFIDEVESTLASHRELPLVLANINYKNNEKKWLREVNLWLVQHGMRPLTLHTPSKTATIFDRIQQSAIPVDSGPKVSILMSCFNAEATIDFSIRSIRQQDYRNIELIIVDDCSTDNTLSIIKRHASEDSRLIVRANERNCGTYRNRNFGLNASRGEYFTGKNV